MLRKQIISISLIYSLLILSLIPAKGLGQQKNKIPENLVSTNNQVPVKEKKSKLTLNENSVVTNDKVFIPKAKTPKFKESLSEYKRESKLKQPIFQTDINKTDFKKLEKVTYKLSDDEEEKKKEEKWGKTETFIVIVGAVLLVGLAILVAKSDCDPALCDPLDEDCICENPPD